MPSGYTESIYNGENPTFRQFALKASRAMGVNIHMKEDSSEAEYRPRTTSDFYGEELEKHQKERDRLSCLIRSEARQPVSLRMRRRRRLMRLT